MPDLTSIHGQPGFLVAVGDAGTIWHLSGTSCSIPPPITTANLNAVCIRHPADGWAAGEAGTLLRWNGQRWSALDSGTTEGLLTIACSPTETWIGGRRTLLRYDQPTGTLTSIPTSGIITSIYIDDAGTAYFLCCDNVVLRFDGQSWRRDLLPGEDDLFQLAGWGHGPLYATGMHGLVCRFDGQRWRRIPIGTDENLCGAACTGPTELWLTTTSGHLLHWNGQRVRTCASLPLGWLDAVCAPVGEHAVYCAGSDGSILRYPRTAILRHEVRARRARRSLRHPDRVRLRAPGRGRAAGPDPGGAGATGRGALI